MLGSAADRGQLDIAGNAIIADQMRMERAEAGERQIFSLNASTYL
jgi:hypothetical protein